MTDYKRLRRLAEKATPGPYGVVGLDDLPDINDLMIISDAILENGEPAWITNIGGSFAQLTESECVTQDEHNALYIAATDPTTVLGLLDHIEELESKIRSHIQ
jgi:hypothetical protein